MGIDSSPSLLSKMKDKVVEMAKNVKKIGKDDPRRIMHCAKVGIALTLNSLLYYYNPLYDDFGQSGIWALLTVILVFEFTVGATLSKSLNRSFATLLAGAMGVGAKYLADLSGDKAEPVVLGLLVFILGAILTFTRFIPGIKTKYDYGVVIFILTFSMVTVSGYRTEQIIQFAHRRLSTVAIGGVTCILISIFVFPAWAGEDLQNLIALNIEKLGRSLEGFGSAYFRLPEAEGEDSGCSKALFPQDYKSAFNSKAYENSLATCAGWEFGHGEFKFGHPWEQYLKVGGLARECASHLQALCGYLNAAADDDRKMQTLLSFKSKIQGPCTRMCSESSQALRDISSAMKTMAQPSPEIQDHLRNSRAAINDLEVVFGSSSLSTTEMLFEIIPCAAVTSILIDIVNCVDKISKSVDELSEKAGFKKPKAKSPEAAEQPPQQQLLHRGIVTPVNEDSPEAVTIDETPQDSPEFDNLQGATHEQKSQELITDVKTG
ncbi:PREDICTED: aluminum-activated malate transporter 8-like isoform X2 [Ipomoea nil]|uniref:aluminum-activated malate transporter 8-like isoform X2 n=1 Tax=Ipomoea nil TaxID=35883 RepID=UPI000901A1E3|nr:PREDICTED: aluminum-activated malate transporter 8-like isoform X2 [Ipomoea nil]